jgi:hypothetical protein
MSCSIRKTPQEEERRDECNGHDGLPGGELRGAGHELVGDALAAILHIKSLD